MKALIVTGGSIQMDFATEYIKKEKFDITIASDSGMEFFYQIGQVPQCIVGDFDSASKEILDYFREKKEIEFHEFRPEKDETDTELALSLAIEKGADEICVLGATGSRMDHVLGNIHLLCKPMNAGRSCYLLDAHNKIQLVDKEKSIEKEKQFGDYISFLPLTTKAEGVNLKGFKYPLEDALMTSDNSLGVSNEISEDIAHVSVKNGILIMIESRDK